MRMRFLNNGVDMSHEVRQNKRFVIIATTTTISVLASLLITYVVLSVTGYEKAPIIFFIATLAPLLIAPAVTWSIVSLVIEVQKLEEDYRNLATNDDLTGLLRRGTFLVQCKSFASLCERNRQPLAFATLDLDRFKHINDEYGHGAGDEVLKEFADTIRRSVRSGDLAGRMGGEEFAVALPGSSVDDAAHVMERIRADTENTEVSYFGQRVRVTVSIGLVGVQGKQLNDLDALIRKSDELLYQAKDRGRNMIVAADIEQ